MGSFLLQLGEHSGSRNRGLVTTDPIIFYLAVMENFLKVEERNFFWLIDA